MMGPTSTLGVPNWQGLNLNQTSIVGPHIACSGNSIIFSPTGTVLQWGINIGGPVSGTGAGEFMISEDGTNPYGGNVLGNNPSLTTAANPACTGNSTSAIVDYTVTTVPLTPLQIFGSIYGVFMPGGSPCPAFSGFAYVIEAETDTQSAPGGSSPGIPSGVYGFPGNLPPSTPATPPYPNGVLSVIRVGTLNWKRSLTYGTKQPWTAYNNGQGVGFTWVGSHPWFLPPGVTEGYGNVG